jgi:hypothetical protein
MKNKDKDIKIIETICTYFQIKYEDMLETLYQRKFSNQLLRKYCIFFLKKNNTPLTRIQILLGYNYTDAKRQYNNIEDFFDKSKVFFSKDLMTLSAIIKYNE